MISITFTGTFVFSVNILQMVLYKYLSASFHIVLNS